jgi:hypothetical protein
MLILFNLLIILQSPVYDMPGLQSTVYDMPSLQSTVHDMPGLQSTVHDMPGLQSTAHNMPGLQSTVYDMPGLQSTIHDMPGLQSTVYDMPGLQSREAVFLSEPIVSTYQERLHHMKDDNQTIRYMTSTTSTPLTSWTMEGMAPHSMSLGTNATAVQLLSEETGLSSLRNPSWPSKGSTPAAMSLSPASGNYRRYKIGR